jgi:hypothetical protein
VELFLKPDTISDGQQQRSTAKTRTNNPHWEPPERFQFIVENMEASRIVISWSLLATSFLEPHSCSYHRFSERNTKVLGDTVIATKDITTTPSIQRLKLINSAGKFKGEVRRIGLWSP